MKNALSQELTNTVPRAHENGQTYINEMSRLVFKDAKSRLILCRLTNWLQLKNNSVTNLTS